MADILGSAVTSAQGFLGLDSEGVTIDNLTFKLFYKATTTLLLVFAALTSVKQFFGDPIACEVPGGGVNEGTLHAYCWMYAGFTFPPNFEGKCVKREHDGSNLYSSYYQWVGLFLIASALIFYVPRAIWLQFEGGLMKFLSKGATGKIVEDASEKREGLVETFKEHLNNKYDKYAALFFICEQLNFVLVTMMWFVTNSFLKYQFIRYGPAVVHYYSLTAEEQKFETDPTCEIFPRIAMCNYKRYGSGGGQTNLEAICILGMNEINDVLFAALWFWYFFLTLFGVSRFMYRLCQLCSDRFRWYVMKVRISRYFKANKSTRYVERYVKTCSYGNWFVLYQMSRNMNRRFFAELLTVLSVQMVDKDELGSDECLIGDVLVKFKDMADGGLFLSKSHVEKLAKDGDLTMSRRPSALLSAPSCISLNDKTMDILSDLGAPDGDKDEGKKQT